MRVSVRPRRWVTLGVALIVALGLVGASARPAKSASGDIGYEDQSFSGTSTPTGTKRPESVLWWNDSSWWANMWHTASH